LTSKSAFKELGVRAGIMGEVRWWSISGRPVYASTGEFVGFRGSGHDLTEKRRSQEEASRLAHYDSLTDLANRFQMAKTLEDVLNASNEAERDCAVFLLDLDRFKQVNDTMGHPAGDALLQQVSKRLTRVVGDEGLVGRLGGDEFKVVLPGVTDRDHLANLAHRIIESLSQPYSIEGDRVVIGASVGISVAPDDGTTSEALIRNADLALYAAKDGGRGRFHFYASDLHQVAEERREMEQDLRDAIQTGALELHYQPVVALDTQTISGFEALMRWEHPKYGMQSPARFVEIAEDAGLITPMGEWALRTACAQLAKWPESVRVAVNVSPLQFSHAQLPAIVTSALAQSGVAPHRLELEITESVFLRDDFNTDAVFAALKAIGVRLALDDFGTGYSSLGYLKKAPFDKIKIDQSFVRGATQAGSRNGAIIASITSLAKSLGMETTAEGVETLDELELVRSLGCSHVQGYVFNQALPAATVSEQLSHGLTIEAKGFHKWRPERQSMLRKVALEHAGEIYMATIRNMGPGGALVEGLWNVPPGTIFNIALSETEIVKATTIWHCDNRMGVAFAEGRAEGDDDLPGSINADRPVAEEREASSVEPVRKAG
ncbi:MAG: EAL domain-containing protein, partial [Novosphingobium sp.]|nr:EAL domain-containing protein [Novosphingobium sp.]